MAEHRGAATYVHLYQDRLVVYETTTHADPVEFRIPSPEVLIPPQALLQVAAQILRGQGWRLGVEGWRRPLDPQSNLIATAHLRAPRSPAPVL